MKPKYYTGPGMLYATYPHKSFYWNGGWYESSVQSHHFEDDTLAGYNFCHLCDVRAIFPGVKAHKLDNYTVALP
jgi:hypothetical protein